MSSQRIAELKTQRGYFAAFGQTEKVKAVDKELAELRSGHTKPPTREAPEKPEAVIETATADHSNTETATVRSAARRKSTKKSSG